MDPLKETIVEKVVDKLTGKAIDTLDTKGTNWFTTRPILAPLISLIPIGGVFAYLGLKQNYKLFLFLILGYDLFLYLFPPILIIFKLLIAYDTWVLANRMRAGKKLGEWEWFWTKNK